MPPLRGFCRRLSVAALLVTSPGLVVAADERGQIDIVPPPAIRACTPEMAESGQRVLDSARAAHPVRRSLAAAWPAVRVHEWEISCWGVAGFACEQRPDGICFGLRLDVAQGECQPGSGSWCFTLPSDSLAPATLEVLSTAVGEPLSDDLFFRGAEREPEEAGTGGGNSALLVALLGAIGLTLLARMKPRVRPWLARGALSLAAAVVAFGVLECGLRLFAHAPAPPVLFRTKTLTIEEVPLNPLFLREAWRQVPDRRSGEMRIGVLGDSFTFGEGVRVDETTPAVLERALRERWPDRPFRVFNLGRSGDGPQEELERLRHLAPQLDLDALVLLSYLNDFPGDRDTSELLSDLLGLRADPGPLGGRSRVVARVWGVWRAHVVERRLVDHYLHAAITAPEQFGPTLKQMRAECERHGIALHMALFPMLVDLDDYPLAPLHAAVAAVAAEQRVPFADLLPAFAGRDAVELRVSVPDEHPNAAAHEITGLALVELLAPAVEARGTHGAP